MNNRNTSLKWLKEKVNIFIDNRIEDVNNPIMGVYGIFVENELEKNKKCVYVGRSESIYDRMFSSNGHVSMMKNRKHFISILNEARENEKIKVFIEVLEEVHFEFDNYFKDMQRLASAENYHINKYQSMNQCLHQVPEGTKISEDAWENMKKKY
ncbi:hypothetical protein BEN51_10580 [Clostridium isatidis]|uniref:GIY-YIG domain-containing protein n=2 Tax=Clostridium isatidis TaxID=182773 RepID=A0A343JG52_9CLOT|nr:hypothetical protein BEN51_10580 [Clostridium isatidis]